MEERRLALLYQLSNNTLMEMIVEMDDAIGTQKEQLRLMAEAVMEAHGYPKYNGDCGECLTCSANGKCPDQCQCPACRVAREVLG